MWKLQIYFFLKKSVIEDCFFEGILKSSTMLIISATAFCKLPCSSLYAANICTLSRRYNALFAVTVASDGTVPNLELVCYVPTTFLWVFTCVVKNFDFIVQAQTSSLHSGNKFLLRHSHDKSFRSKPIQQQYNFQVCFFVMFTLISKRSI